MSVTYGLIDGRKKIPGCPRSILILKKGRKPNEVVIIGGVTITFEEYVAKCREAGRRVCPTCRFNVQGGREGCVFQMGASYLRDIAGFIVEAGLDPTEYRSYVERMITNSDDEFGPAFILMERLPKFIEVCRKLQKIAEEGYRRNEKVFLSLFGAMNLLLPFLERSLETSEPFGVES
ncbi:MAG: hypothetical protein QXT68_10120 [Halobacteria archaeon]